MSLSNEQKAQFERDGYLVIRSLLTAAELEAVRERADQIASGEAEHVPERWVQPEPAVARGEVSAATRALAVRKLWSLVAFDDVMRAHASHPRILAVIRDLLGPDIKLYGDQLFMKPPHIGSRKEYHQDSNSWKAIEPYDLVSCWAALDDATEENGCLRVLPGSHKWGLLGKEKERTLERRALEEGIPEEVAVPLRAGDCSFHHSLLLHCSAPNTSGLRRRGYATHYMSARCRYVGDPTNKSEYLLLCGRSYEGCV
jgi:ectoine hydroxylase-related dioxygenase (phytanoyl-CoA dioxygenase family)